MGGGVIQMNEVIRGIQRESLAGIAISVYKKYS